MNKIKILVFAAALLVTSTVGTIMISNSVHAAEGRVGGLSTGIEAGKDDSNDLEITGDEGLIKRVMDTSLWLIGVVSVMVMIYGGFLYTTASGDSNKVTTAKTTILYAIIGLIISMFAYAIVSFINTQFAG